MGITTDRSEPPPIDANRQVEEALRIVSNDRVRREALAEEAQQAADARQRQQRECERLAAYKRSLEGGGFFYRKDDPDRGALSDEEIAAEIASAEHSLTVNCRG